MRMIEAVRGFLDLMAASEPPSHEALARALDALAFAYHETPPGCPSQEEIEPPDEEYRLVRQRIGKQFPDFGLYGTADPLKVLNETPLVGDAIDDLTDITRDLQEILWRWENLGPDDACWYFRLGYHSHWGRHLYEVRLYLHAKQF